MGRRMANSSIVQLTFTHRRGENRLPSQVLTLILIHIKQTMPHRRGVPLGQQCLGTVGMNLQPAT